MRFPIAVLLAILLQCLMDRFINFKYVKQDKIVLGHFIIPCHWQIPGYWLRGNKSAL